jgi:hypothetical protein
VVPDTSADAPAAAHAPDASGLDAGAIRRSWPQVLALLTERRQMILKANLESATAASFDGTTLELAFPPGRPFAVEKVRSKESELRDALVAVFGVSPRIVCIERGGPIGVVGDPALDADEDEPIDAATAEERLKAEFGAEVEPDGDAEGR